MKDPLLTFFFTSFVHLILPVYVWPCWLFFQAVFPDKFVFGRNRSNVAHSSWWSSSLDGWSCGNLGFYQQHNCCRYICFSWWQGIFMTNMIIACLFLSMIITFCDSYCSYPRGLTMLDFEDCSVMDMCRIWRFIG
jgi:hypothetical protein